MGRGPRCGSPRVALRRVVRRRRPRRHARGPPAARRGDPAHDGLTVRDVAGGSRTVRLGATDRPSAAATPRWCSWPARARTPPPSSRRTAAGRGPHGACRTAPARPSRSSPRYGPAAVGCSSMVGATLDAARRRDPHLRRRDLRRRPRPRPTPKRSVRSWRRSPATFQSSQRDDIESVLWSKAVLAVGAMGLPVLLRLPYHHVFTEPRARELFLDLVSDAAAVAGGRGHTAGRPARSAAGGQPHRPAPPEALARLEEVGRSMVAAGQTSVRGVDAAEPGDRPAARGRRRVRRAGRAGRCPWTGRAPAAGGRPPSSARSTT